MTTPSTWSFRYEGPPRPVDDGDCHECIAVATKKARKGPEAYVYHPPVNGPPARLTVAEFRGILGSEPIDRIPETVEDPTGPLVLEPALVQVLAHGEHREPVALACLPQRMDQP